MDVDVDVDGITGMDDSSVTAVRIDSSLLMLLPTSSMIGVGGSSSAVPGVLSGSIVHRTVLGSCCKVPGKQE